MAKAAAIASALSSKRPNCTFSDIFVATASPALKTSAGEAVPPPAPIWKRLSTIAFANVGPCSSTKAKKPTNMMRRTSSLNQPSSDAACKASQTAAMPISIVARIQKRDLAAFITVASQPFAAVMIWFCRDVRTEPS
ncbi:hypothetical protein D9M69_582530 [compost metagenome]